MYFILGAELTSQKFKPSWFLLGAEAQFHLFLLHTVDVTSVLQQLPTTSAPCWLTGGRHQQLVPTQQRGTLLRHSWNLQGQVVAVLISLTKTMTITKTEHTDNLVY